MKAAALDRKVALKNVLAVFAILCMLFHPQVYTAIYYALAQSSPFLGYVKTASYIIYKSGSTYYAIDGTTGVELTSGMDATTVVQAAIHDLNSNGGGLVFIKGTITLNDNLILKEGVNLAGEGAGRTRSGTLWGSVLYTSTANNVITIEGTLNNQFIKDLGIVNDKAGGNAIEIFDETGGNSYYFGLLIENCEIYATQYGVYAHPTDANELLITNSRITGNGAPGGKGIYVASGMSDNIFRGNIIRGFEIGMHLVAAANQIIGNHIYRAPASNITYDLYLEGPKNVIIGNYLEGKPTTAAIYAKASIQQIIGNHIWAGSGADGIYMDLPSPGTLAYVQIKDNYIEGTLGANADSNVEFGANVTSFYHIVIRDNTHRYVDNVIYTEFRGSATVANNEWIAHNLIGRPTNVQITPKEMVYDGITFTVGCIARNNTHFQVGVYWTNGTAISDDTIDIDWDAKFES